MRASSTLLLSLSLLFSLISFSLSESLLPSSLVEDDEDDFSSALSFLQLSSSSPLLSPDTRPSVVSENSALFDEELAQKMQFLKLQAAASRAVTEKADEQNALRQLASAKLREVKNAEREKSSSSSSPLSAPLSSSAAPLSAPAVSEEGQQSALSPCQQAFEKSTFLSSSLSSAESLLIASKKQLVSLRRTARQVESSLEQEKQSFSRQIALIDMLLSSSEKEGSSSEQEDQVFRQEKMTRLFSEAASSSSDSPSAQTLRKLHSVLATAENINAARAQLLQLRSRIEMEQERTALRAQQALDDVQTAVSLIAERQKTVDDLATQLALAEQNVRTLRLEGISC